MRRRLIVLLAIVLVLSVIAAAPVSAKEKPISGKMELTLNLWNCPNNEVDDPGPFLTWTGTVVIDGTTYGWADEPLPVADPPPPLPNEKFVYFEEHWTIFDLEDGEDPNEDPSLACDATVVLEGVNTGWGPPGTTGKADGTVTASSGPFAGVEVGSRMFWRGDVLGYPPNTPELLPPGTEFKATLHILP